MSPSAILPRVSAVPLVGSGVVAALSLGVSAASYRAMLRTGNSLLGFLVAAFLLLGVKSALKVAFLLRGAVPAAWEATFTLADVAAFSLIAWPLLRRGRA